MSPRFISRPSLPLLQPVKKKMRMADDDDAPIVPHPRNGERVVPKGETVPGYSRIRPLALLSRPPPPPPPPRNNPQQPPQSPPPSSSSSAIDRSVGEGNGATAAPPRATELLADLARFCESCGALLPAVTPPPPAPPLSSSDDDGDALTPPPSFERLLPGLRLPTTTAAATATATAAEDELVSSAPRPPRVSDVDEAGAVDGDGDGGGIFCRSKYCLSDPFAPSARAVLGLAPSKGPGAASGAAAEVPASGRDLSRYLRRAIGAYRYCLSSR